MTLTLWGRANSVNVQKPLWLLQELGLEFNREDAGGPFGRLDSPEFTALSPHGEIPVLVDERFGASISIWESAAINRHLAEAAGREGRPLALQLWPQDLAARAQIDRWAEWAQVNWYPPVRDLFLQIVRVATPDRNIAAIKSAADTANNMASRIEACLQKSGGALAGTDLSLADIPFAGLLHRYMTIEITRPDLPELTRYYERMKARPFYAQTVAVDYDGMRIPGAERSPAPIV